MELRIMVEIPKGSRNKYEYDKDTNQMRLDRVLHSPVHYPTDYGFIPDTLAEDGDPLDVLVLIGEPTFPGCFIDVRPIGMLHMSDEKGVDQKVLTVPVTDPFWKYAQDIKDIPEHILTEIEHFFTIYKQLEEKKTVVEGWRDRGEALKAIANAQQQFKK
ncbi:inorganic diphosphatase [bacterium]|jgi:inorganic pyrophosphatase|nr:inorganic diphosphatase [bacterium]MBT5015541.1 inorganic diphosphatase [bacterium]